MPLPAPLSWKRFATLDIGHRDSKLFPSPARRDVSSINLVDTSNSSINLVDTASRMPRLHFCLSLDLALF